jgi:hypothetical protein
LTFDYKKECLEDQQEPPQAPKKEMERLNTIKTEQPFKCTLCHNAGREYYAKSKSGLKNHIRMYHGKSV